MPEFMFTVSANFTAETQQEAWDEWVEWLRMPGAIEDGTEVTELPPLTDDDIESEASQHLFDQDKESS